MVLVDVVDVGLTILLKVDNLPCDIVPITSLSPFIVLRGNLRNGIGCVTVRAVLLIIIVDVVQVWLGVGGHFSSVCPCLGCVSSDMVSLASGSLLPEDVPSIV